MTADFKPLSPVGQRVLDQLDLNGDEEPALRLPAKRLLRMQIAAAGPKSPDQIVRDAYDELFRYPEDLPDLSKLSPPAGNSKPEGLERSHFARRERNDLPTHY